ncbi:MAG: tetratricopeptide repeat protein, partial [Eudoraea sp.]|nr:tetratricopeptide repeat protein [Eudoraea sp.]
MNLIKKKAYFIVGFFGFTLTAVHGFQDQKLADSLISVYQSGTYQEDERAILEMIAQEETNPDLKLSYSDLLIQKAAQDSSSTLLHKAYLQRGNALQLKGDNAEALKSFLKSLEFAEGTDDKIGIGSLMISIGDSYSAMENSKNAQAYYSRGIQILRELNDSIKIATGLLNAGDDYFNNGQLDSALIYTEEATLIFQNINYPIGKAYGFGNLGMIYAEQERDALAEANINNAVLILEELQDYYPISVYLTYMADIYKRKNDLKTALEYAHRSLDLAMQSSLKDEVGNAHFKLSQLYEIAGDTVTSFMHFKDHVTYRDSVRNLEAVQDMADLRLDYEVSQKQIEVDLAEARQKNQRNISIATAIALLLILLLATGLYRRNKFIKKTNKIIAAEKDRSDNLLLNILPEKTARELKAHGRVKADRFESVSVLFTDFKGFTRISEKLSPEVLVESVDYYFSKFDEIMGKYGLEKIKTIGDAYMCAGGLPFPSNDHAEKMILAAQEIVDFVQECKEKGAEGHARLDIRVGINTGPVVAGVVGTKKFSYDIWGDTVNVASRMESNSEPGRINISENTYQLVRDKVK